MLNHLPWRSGASGSWTHRLWRVSWPTRRKAGREWAFSILYANYAIENFVLVFGCPNDNRRCVRGHLALGVAKFDGHEKAIERQADAKCCIIWLPKTHANSFSCCIAAFSWRKSSKLYCVLHHSNSIGYSPCKGRFSEWPFFCQKTTTFSMVSKCG